MSNLRAVSAALISLQQMDMVEKIGDRWQLTEKGRPHQRESEVLKFPGGDESNHH